jgi:hypothetical protein
MYNRSAFSASIDDDNDNDNDNDDDSSGGFNFAGVDDIISGSVEPGTGAAAALRSSDDGWGDDKPPGAAAAAAAAATAEAGASENVLPDVSVLDKGIHAHVRYYFQSTIGLTHFSVYRIV